MDEQPDVEEGEVFDVDYRPHLDEAALQIALMYQVCLPGGQAFDQLSEFALNTGIRWSVIRRAFRSIRRAILEWWHADNAANAYEISAVDTSAVRLGDDDRQAIMDDFWSFVNRH
jgi:hypothetical protein